MFDNFRDFKKAQRSIVNINFNIDPSVSKIADEHMRLVDYFKERKLTIDVFNGDNHFYYGSCQVPLYELCRQGLSVMVRPKECEIYNAAASGKEKKSNGFLQLVMTNTGAIPAVYEEIEKYDRSSASGEIKVADRQNRDKLSNYGAGAKLGYKKNIISNPMTYNQVRDAMSQYNDVDSSVILSRMDVQSQQQPSFQPDISGIEINDTQSKISAMDMASRKRMRIERIKKRAAKDMTN